MKFFKSFFQRFKFFTNSNHHQNDRLGALSYLKSKLDGIPFFPSKKQGTFRLIAPKNQDPMRLPNSMNDNIPQIGSFSQLQSLSHINQSQQTEELQLFQQALDDTNYKLLFKGLPQLNLKVINRWSDIPALYPIKDALAKHFGESLNPIQKVVLPSLLSGENHVIQHAADQATRILFLIPAFMYLLQTDVKEENEVKVVILAKDEESVNSVNQDIEGLKNIFQQGFNVSQIQSHILIDTPSSLLAKLRQNQIRLQFIQYFVVSDLTAIQQMGYAEDIVAINSYINEAKQTVVISEEIRNDSLVIDSLMSNFKVYLFVLTQYAQAMMEDYALKASLWTIMLLLAVIAYLSYKVTTNKKEQKK